MATEIIERWFVLSYDATTKAYKRNDVKEDIAEFLLLLKNDKKDFKIRQIESHSDSTIHFGYDTNTVINDYKYIIEAFKSHDYFKNIDFSLSLISINQDNESIFFAKSKQPLKKNFDAKIIEIKKELGIK